MVTDMNLQFPQNVSFQPVKFIQTSAEAQIIPFSTPPLFF
jgi:hypothetical protein